MEKNFTPMLVVAAALSDGEGRWLMHRRPPGKDHAGLWEFPGGKVETGESPSAALVRELEEEAGIVIDLASSAPITFAEGAPPLAERSIVILLYTVTRWVGTIAGREGGTFAWYEPQEILALQKPPLDVELALQLFEKTG